MTSLSSDGLDLPRSRLGELLPRRAPMPRLVKRRAQASDDQAPHCRRVAETDLGLGRVDVNVDFGRRHLDEQRGDRMTVAGKQVAVGCAERPDQQPILHWARVDEQKLLVGHAAIEGRQADDAGQPQAIADAVDAEPVPVELMAEQRRDPRRRVRRLN